MDCGLTSTKFRKLKTSFLRAYQRAKIKPTPRKLTPAKIRSKTVSTFISSGMLVERTPSYHARLRPGWTARNTSVRRYCDRHPEVSCCHKPGDNFSSSRPIQKQNQARFEKFEMSGHADSRRIARIRIQARRAHRVDHGDPPPALFAAQLAEKYPKAKVLDPSRCRLSGLSEAALS